MATIQEKQDIVETEAHSEWVRDNTQPHLLTVNEMLAEREDRYGAFENHAARSQALKEILIGGASSWSHMKPFQRESIEMIAHKLARIMNGDPNYIDNWTDIAGYAQLVVDILEQREVGA